MSPQPALDSAAEPAPSRPAATDALPAASTALQALAHSFHAMAENVPGALFRYRLGPDGRDTVEYMSSGCVALWEVPAQSIEEDATLLWQMVHDDDRPAMQASVLASAHTLSHWRHEWRITTPSGVHKWLEGRGVPQALPDGGVLWNSLILDVTARKQIECELHQLNTELERRVAERTAAMAAATAEAERANRAKSEFIAALSHELRTPMNAVLGFGQLLALEPDLPPRARDHVQALLRGGRHLMTLVDEVLELSRVESGHIDLQPQALALPALLEDCRALLAPLAQQHGVHCPPAAVPPEARAWADTTRLQQVLLNLLSNAIKYNRPHGQVQVTVTAPTPDRVAIAVSDTGPGIAAERLAELFQPFNRLGAERTAVPGTGIGLVIARELVERMDGRLEVHSIAGAGSCFTVELPQGPPVAAP
jgi:signal transduction histidine kinase